MQNLLSDNRGIIDEFKFWSKKKRGSFFFPYITQLERIFYWHIQDKKEIFASYGDLFDVLSKPRKLR